MAVRTCIVCGCTDGNACVQQLPNGATFTCCWVDEDVCSFCEPSSDDGVRVDPGSELILPGDPEFHL